MRRNGEEERLCMSVSQAAHALGVSLGTAYELVRQGRLPAVRLSRRRIVVPRKALEKLLEEGTPSEPIAG